MIPHIAISLEILQKVTAQDNELKFTFVRKWGTNGTGPNHFVRPHDVDSHDRVYIVDGASNPRVQIFDTSGTFLGKIGKACNMSSGEGCKDLDGLGPLELGDGQFSKPEHVSIDAQGNVFVVDRGNKRIQVFAPLFNLSHNKNS